MEVEYTARQGKITKAVRTQAEDGLARLDKILGKTAHANLILASERHLMLVELTIQARQRLIAAVGKADTIEAALKLAIDHAASQAKRARDRRIETKRLPKEEKVMTALPVTRTKSRRAIEPMEEAPEDSAVGKSRKPIAVHSFPAPQRIPESHVIATSEALVEHPLRIEEAVKELEYRDRELLIFHSPDGHLYAMHRRRDGNIALVEIA